MTNAIPERPDDCSLDFEDRLARIERRLVALAQQITTSRAELNRAISDEIKHAEFELIERLDSIESSVEIIARELAR